MIQLLCSDLAHVIKPFRINCTSNNYVQIALKAIIACKTSHNSSGTRCKKTVLATRSYLSQTSRNTSENQTKKTSKDITLNPEEIYTLFLASERVHKIAESVFFGMTHLCIIDSPFADEAHQTATDPTRFLLI